MRPLSQVVLDGDHIVRTKPYPLLEGKQPNRLLWGVAGLMFAVALTAWLTGARIADRPEMIEVRK